MRQPELWRAHRRLCETYGDVVHLSMFGEHFIVLGSQQAIFDLLDKQSAATSDRPQNPLIKLCGQGFNFGLYPYGQWWRRHRRVFSQYIPLTVPEEQLLIQHEYATLFLRKLLTDPVALCDHIRYVFSATIVKIMYGVQVANDGDPSVALIIRTLDGLKALLSGQMLVQYLPILRHVPMWVPVLGTQLRQLAEWRAAADEVKQVLFSKTQDDLVQGRENTSVLGRSLQELDEKKGDVNLAEEHLVAMNTCITAFEGAAETTFSTIQGFFLAMSLNRDVQKKAQVELDSVVGPHRLPEYRDRASLPYVDAVLKESLRWHNVAPFGLLHCAGEDVEYRGYFIPKGTTFMSNVWACMHDPEVYANPDRFLPDRFIRDGKLDPEVRDPSDFVFGFGRRICPGRAFAEAQMFDIIAMVLHVFEITPPLDEHGHPIDIEPRVGGTFLLYPEDCRCTLKPRSAQAEALFSGKRSS
ncbi:CyP450 monooxygenase [Lentinus tigrinus ALCF2SS1-6]|uniref:CyP450 monooxygenase n=1 Tax=Lentinus tigrinus ALCF2SS1-6 TaxID=1328759 RepID=A0A5C2SGK9_9APHY|nr:CyP450 monooxygenase [Lentinus tigrinus ALCF2SS1-6]